jgi:hypothetical protein
VNDLDIIVVNKTHTFTPLVTNALDPVTNQRYDRYNNLEFISIHPCSQCSYSVIVKARSLSRAQPYSLVITGEVGKYTYSESYNGVTSGLTQRARIAVITATCAAFCLTICVMWIAFGRPVRRRRINEVKEIYRRAASNASNI